MQLKKFNFQKKMQTSHLLNLMHGWKLTSSRSRGLMNERVRSGIPLNLIKQSIWNVFIQFIKPLDITVKWLLFHSLRQFNSFIYSHILGSRQTPSNQTCQLWHRPPQLHQNKLRCLCISLRFSSKGHWTTDQSEVCHSYWNIKNSLVLVLSEFMK